MRGVKITSEYITLGQFLKFSGIISNGGEAKNYLQNTEIKVNFESENRRGRKLYPGDLVSVKGLDYKIEQKQL